MRTFLSLGIILVLKWTVVHASFDVRSLTSDETSFSDVAPKYEESFNTLASKYEHQPDKSKVDVMEDMKAIMRTYCEGDSSCDLAIDEAIDAADKTFMDGTLEIGLPEDMDSAIKVSLDRAIEAILPLDEDNHDEIIETLTEIKRELEETEGVDPFFKQFGVGAMDVALNGVTFWHDAFFDEENLLHFLVESNDERRLQSCLITATAPAIIVIAALAGYISIIPRYWYTTLFLNLISLQRVPIIKWLFAPLYWTNWALLVTAGTFRAAIFTTAAIAAFSLPAALCVVKSGVIIGVSTIVLGPAFTGIATTIFGGTAVALSFMGAILTFVPTYLTGTVAWFFAAIFS